MPAADAPPPEEAVPDPPAALLPAAPDAAVPVLVPDAAEEDPVDPASLDALLLAALLLDELEEPAPGDEEPQPVSAAPSSSDAAARPMPAERLWDRCMCSLL
ncbi:hypothetical protein [Nakamurella endophytica]|nr:hypothetical protein [Nakamurella endophytica]